MKVKLNKNVQEEFPCLMSSDLGQILLVRSSKFNEQGTVYNCCVVYDATDTRTNLYIGTTWETKNISKYSFLPKGYKITITN